MTRFKDTVSGTVDKGVAYPKTTKRSLSSRSPDAIRKKMLSPMARTIFSASWSLFSFRRLRIISPGIAVRKRKPKSCLKTGMSNRMAKSVMMINIRMRRRNLLALEIFNNLIISYNAANILAKMTLNRQGDGSLGIR
jgi:hypothetical protein